MCGVDMILVGHGNGFFMAVVHKKTWRAAKKVARYIAKMVARKLACRRPSLIDTPFGVMGV